MHLPKLLFAGTAAAAMATGLGLIMVNLIHVDFEAEAETEVLDFAINFEVEPICDCIAPTLAMPVRAEDIEIPPPFERFEVVDATKPKEDIFVTETIPPFDPPILGPDDYFSVSIDTENPTPIVRFPGRVPDKALREGRSGHCNMIFSVNTLGATYNVRAKNCSHYMFETSSISATQRFKYRPRLQGGQPVDMHGVTTKITYRVLDEDGRLMPE